MRTEDIEILAFKPFRARFSSRILDIRTAPEDHLVPFILAKCIRRSMVSWVGGMAGTAGRLDQADPRAAVRSRGRCR